MWLYSCRNSKIGTINLDNQDIQSYCCDVRVHIKTLSSTLIVFYFDYIFLNKNNYFMSLNKKIGKYIKYYSHSCLCCTENKMM